MTWRVKTLRAVAEVTLGRQRAPEHMAGPHIVPYLRAANVKDGQLILDDVLTMNFSMAEQQRFGLEPRDVLVTEGCGSLGQIGASTVYRGELGQTLCFQNTLLRLRARSGVTDGRFLAWWARAAFASGLFASIAAGANIYHLSAERVRSLPFLLPPLDEQRRIADFLDTETTKLDQQRSTLANLRELVLDRERSILERILSPDGQIVESGAQWLDGRWRWTPLSHLTDPLRPIMYGIVLPGPNVDDGVPIVKGGDIAAHRLRSDLLCRTTREIEVSHRRSRLRGGDLVIAIRGSVGEVEAVPDELTGANLTQDAARVSVGRCFNGRWLELVLQTPSVSGQIQERVTGATIKGINIWDLKRVVIPVPTGLESQARLAEIADRELRLHEQIVVRVERQMDLLTERRRSLITAAIAGEFDATTAHGGVLDATLAETGGG